PAAPRTGGVGRLASSLIVPRLACALRSHDILVAPSKNPAYTTTILSFLPSKLRGSMLSADTCPNQEQLRRLAQGTATAAKNAPLTALRVDCHRCTALLAELSQARTLPRAANPSLPIDSHVQAAMDKWGCQFDGVPSSATLAPTQLPAAT